MSDTIYRKIGVRVSSMDEFHRLRQQCATALTDGVLILGVDLRVRNVGVRREGFAQIVACCGSIQFLLVGGQLKRMYDNTDRIDIPRRALLKLLSGKRWERAAAWKARRSP